MKELSSPINLIKKSLSIFFEKKNMIYFLKIFSIPFLISLVTFIFSYFISNAGYTSDQYVDEFLKGNPMIILFVAVWSIAAFLIGIWAQVAGYESIKRAVNGGNLDFKDTFKSSRKYIIKFLTVGFLVGLVIVLGLILLVIPGIIFSVWYAFAIWFVVDKDQGIIESMKSSKGIVKGRFWKVFGRSLVFILFGILGQIVFSFIPQGFGSVVGTLFGALFLIPTYLLFKELEAR